MKVKVYRFNKDENVEPYYDVFELPINISDDYTVMDVLDYISLNIDPTLSYYKHSACNHGICGRCLIIVNGNPKLACITKVESDELILEPVFTKEIVKDLIVI